jgi:capping protein beta
VTQTLIGKQYTRAHILDDKLVKKEAKIARSPWSNEYEPELLDGNLPSTALRRLEIAANEAFDTYREMYYGGGVSSVYLWDLDTGFAGVVAIKKGRSSY